jgi:SAM-dependent methyltransferase
MSHRDPTPSERRHRAALEQYRRRARVYDLELALFEPLRRMAIARLGLLPGQVVFDVGCGTGLSLEALRRGVGAHGHVVGIEQSPPMIERARRVVERHGWHNVTLIESSIASARLAATGDAALFHFTHDILREPPAVQAMHEQLRAGARVVACGLQWTHIWAWPVNLFVLGAALRSVTSLDGLDRPWSVLAEHLEHLTVESVALGAVFLVGGSNRRPAGPATRRPAPR